MALRLFILRCLSWACLMCSAGWAFAGSVLIVASDRGAGYAEVREALIAELERKGLSRAEVTVRLASEVGAGDVATPERNRMVITLGAEALRQVLANEPHVPVIAALIPRLGFERVLGDAPRKASSGVTALYLDQPFGRQLDLLTLAIPAAKRVGVLWGSDSLVHQRILVAAAQARGLELVHGSVGADGAMFSPLRAVLDSADVMLAVADPQVFNSTNISNILLTTYRARIPLMAFSPAYVKAGAYVSLHTTAVQIGAQAATMAVAAMQSGAITPPQYPTDFVVEVNEFVARSLGLTGDGAALAERLRRLERRP